MYICASNSVSHNEGGTVCNSQLICVGNAKNMQALPKKELQQFKLQLGNHF